MPFSPAKDIAGSDKAAQIASAVLAANENRDDRNDGSVLFNSQADLVRDWLLQSVAMAKAAAVHFSIHRKSLWIRSDYTIRVAFDVLISLAVFGLVGALGEKDNVSHAFQPEGRSSPSNSPYAFRFM
jgi:hypothetical protein